MTKILIVRFSAMGDVAMTVPIVYSLAVQYPELDITVLSRNGFSAFFENLPRNVHFYGADLKGKHHGLLGLHKLFYELKALHFDYVADFHSVLRTLPFRIRFKLMCVPVARIHKGRKGKDELVRKEHKVMKQQETSFQRYADVLARLGFPLEPSFKSIYENEKGYSGLFKSLTPAKADKEIWIGIAPFAKHKGKIYPLDLMEQVVGSFSKKSDVHLFLFGSGAEEESVMQKWANRYQQVFITYRHLDLSGELSLMSHLDVLISMDSANMHMASLVGTPVVSIWGATHSYAGFMGWGQKEENMVQLDLGCRPCSVYGNKPCFRGDYACMNNITPDRIVQKVMDVIE